MDMELTRLTRRVVAGVTSLILLLYLTATVAHACILGTAGPRDAAIMPEPSCCESAAVGSMAAGPDCCQEHYFSPQATPAVPHLAALAAAGLSPLAARPAQLVFAERVIAAAGFPPARAAFPPQHILYSRLRN
ncbi:MAG: hypothetical protein ACK4N4_01360 [Burkholderiales bacterium]